MKVTHSIWGRAQFFHRKPMKNIEYKTRLENEEKAYANCIEVHDLPDIFHYWSNKYLLPMFQPFGFTHPNEFFSIYVREQCLKFPNELKRIVSIGSGNGELEVEISKQLVDSGITNFIFDCIEINKDMNSRAAELSRQSGVSSKINFLREDFNTWCPTNNHYDVVIANQSLHHVLELEHLFDSIFIGLNESGVFLTSDMIGRNGHQRWPEALRLVDEFWQELPAEYRYNQLLKREEKHYINHDCSTSGFEGIRAQEILPLLVERFNFELFLPFGNLVFVFVDRPFGHNFDAQGTWDKDFIDRVHAADEKHFIDGHIKPTSMVAAMTLKPSITKLRNDLLTQEFCIRHVNEQNLESEE